MKTFRQMMAAVGAYVMRNRVKVFDLSFLSVVMSAAILVAYEVDIFPNDANIAPRQATIELDEMLALTTFFVFCMLVFAWRRAQELKRENARRIAAEQEVLNLAMHDPLTTLPNRRQFDETLKAALSTIPSAPEAHAVFVLDLNGFKKINDLYGHPVGDQVLITVGARLIRAVRDGDLVARMGGDEFAVLARNVSGAEGATNVALRIIDCLASPVIVAGVAHSVGAAIGVVLSPQDGDSPVELLRKADVALYRAKADRKSAVRFFELEMDARLLERKALELSLRNAGLTDQYCLRFQPARFGASDVIGFEAMPRWAHPSLGDLEPERFLPIVEEVGLLPTLTAHLLHQACQAASTWPGHLLLSFNLPGALLSDVTFGLRILTVLCDTGVAPTRLSLEIDEGALIRDADAAQSLLAPLRSAGVAIVAANFGTGYSDLQNLHRLRLDGVKLDRNLVAAMVDDREAAVIVSALIGIGKGLDLSIMADGVRNEAQQAALAAKGCEVGQGLLYGGLLSAEEASAIAMPAAVSDPVRRMR